MKNVRPPILREPNPTRKRVIRTKAIAPAALRSLGDRVKAGASPQGNDLTSSSPATLAFRSVTLLKLKAATETFPVLVLRRLAKALSMSVDVLLVEGAEPSVELTHTVEFLRRLSLDDLKLARHMLLQQFGGLDPAARHRRIALIGLRGAGKSHFGGRTC